MINTIKLVSLVLLFLSTQLIQDLTTAFLTGGGFFLIYSLCVLHEYREGVKHDREMKALGVR